MSAPTANIAPVNTIPGAKLSSEQLDELSAEASVSSPDKKRFESMLPKISIEMDENRKKEIYARSARDIYEAQNTDVDRLKVYRYFVVDLLIPADKLGASVHSSVKRIHPSFRKFCEAKAKKRNPKPGSASQKK